MKKLAILFAVAALSACSDSSEGQSPADAGPSMTDKGVVAAPAENAAARARRAELAPQYTAARDAFRETRARWREKDEQLKNAIAANSPDVDRIKEEAEQLRLAFVAAQEKFTPIYEEWTTLSAQIEAQRSAE